MALICLEAACESSQSGLAVQKCFSTKSLRVFLNQISSKKQCRSHEALYNIFKANSKNLKYLLFVLIHSFLGFCSICFQHNEVTSKTSLPYVFTQHKLLENCIPMKIDIQVHKVLYDLILIEVTPDNNNPTFISEEPVSECSADLVTPEAS